MWPNYRINLCTGCEVDFGAAWLHGGSSSSHPLRKLCKELNIETVDSDQDSAVIMSQGRDVTRECYGVYGEAEKILEKEVERVMENEPVDIPLTGAAFLPLPAR